MPHILYFSLFPPISGASPGGTYSWHLTLIPSPLRSSVPRRCGTSGRGSLSALPCANHNSSLPPLPMVAAWTGIPSGAHLSTLIQLLAAALNFWIWFMAKRLKGNINVHKSKAITFCFVQRRIISQAWLILFCTLFPFTVTTFIVIQLLHQAFLSPLC